MSSGLDSLRLRHFSDRVVDLDHRRAYAQTEPTWYGKPNGFWVSVEGPDDWPAFCRDSEWGHAQLQVQHAVALTEQANILLITGPDGMDALEREFGSVKPRFPGSDFRATSIDWGEIAKRYDGIIITPYQWSSRMSRDWYYTWDCASGCIWNAGAIASVTAMSSELDTITEGAS